MTNQQLNDLLERASRFMNEYACAIDSQLYRCGSFYNNDKEQEVRDLAVELEIAASELKR